MAYNIYLEKICAALLSLRMAVKFISILVGYTFLMRFSRILNIFLSKEGSDSVLTFGSIPAADFNRAVAAMTFNVNYYLYLEERVPFFLISSRKLE